MTDDQAHPAPDPTCNCGHSVVQHHFYGTHGCRVCNCGSFSRPAPPTEREEREEIQRGDSHTLRGQVGAIAGELIHRCALAEGWEYVPPDWEVDATDLIDRLTSLRTHSPEEPCREDEAEAFGNLVGIYERDGRLVDCAAKMVEMGYDALQLNALVCWVLGDEKPEPLSPEEPVGYCGTCEFGHRMLSQYEPVVDRCQAMLEDLKICRGEMTWTPVGPIGPPLDTQDPNAGGSE